VEQTDENGLNYPPALKRMRINTPRRSSGKITFTVPQKINLPESILVVAARERALTQTRAEIYLHGQGITGKPGKSAKIGPSPARSVIQPVSREKE
jgi:hypothetical protein